VAPGVDLQAVLMSSAQKAVMKNLASHDGSMTFFRPIAKQTAFNASGQKVPKKLKNLDSPPSG
jgi:hypothetical protein